MKTHLSNEPQGAPKVGVCGVSGIHESWFWNIGEPLTVVNCQRCRGSEMFRSITNSLAYHPGGTAYKARRKDADEILAKMTAMLDKWCRDASGDYARALING